MRTRIIRLDTFETLTLHADPERSFTRSIEVTSNPVDGAADSTDHANSTLDPFSIVGVVTEIGIIEEGGAAEGESPIDDALSFLERAEEQRLRVVVPRRGVYSPVLLTSWDNSDPRSEEVEFDLTFQEYREATAQTVQIPPQRTPEPDLASGTDAGSQSTISYFRPEVPKNFGDESYAEQFQEAKGRETDEEVANKSLAVKGVEWAEGGQ